MVLQLRVEDRVEGLGRPCFFEIRSDRAIGRLSGSFEFRFGR